jgi:other hect domain ubiquitin protein ligase E3
VLLTPSLSTVSVPSPPGSGGGGGGGSAAAEEESAFRAAFPRQTFVDEGEELIPDGARVDVTVKTRMAFVEMVIARRKRLVAPAAEAIRRGMGNVIPDRGIALCSDRDLRVLVCGPDQIDGEVLKRFTRYGRPFSEAHPVVQRFWQVFDRMSHRERQLLIRYAWGRSKLPPNDASWRTSDGQVSFFLLYPFYRETAGPGLVERGDESLVESHTCFFQLKLPFYTSAEVLRRQLMTSITQGMGPFSIL